MAKFPQANLGNEATRWGADVERRILDAERDAARRKEGELNANKQGQSSMGLLSQQVKDLTAQQAALATQQAALTAQNATLTAQVATIASVVSKQVIPDVGHNAASNYSLNTGQQELCRITFTVPSGYTRALVLGTTTFSIFNQSSTQSDVVRGFVDINGVSSTPSPALVNPINYQQVTNSRTALLSGLTPGGTYYVRTIGYNQFGNTGASTGLNIANIDAQVIYLQ